LFGLTLEPSASSDDCDESQGKKRAEGLINLVARVWRRVFDFLVRAHLLPGLADELVRALEACAKHGLGFVNLFFGGMVWH
jgi:hypothetical protein